MPNHLVHWRRLGLSVLAFLAASVFNLITAAEASQSASLQRRSVLGAGAAQADVGIRVTVVVPNSAAERAQLRVSDNIIAVGDHAISSAADFLTTIKSLPAGKPIEYEVLRDGIRLKLPVVLATAPTEVDPAVVTLYEALSVAETSP